MVRGAGIALVLMSACTWGTYDLDASYDAASLGEAGDSGPTGTLVTAGGGGTVTSADGWFAVFFVNGALNVNAYVTITRTDDVSGLPFCTKSLACNGSYTVSLQAAQSGGPTAQIVRPIEVGFRAGLAGVGPQQQTFIVTQGHAMPGVWDGTNDVSGFDRPSTSSILGPYTIGTFNSSSVPSANACGGHEVCDSCATNCGTQRFAPPPPAGIHEACMVVGTTPTTDGCLGQCMGTGSETCP